MNHPDCPTQINYGFACVVAMVLTLSLIFLQEGLTYYVSFQMTALLTVAIIIAATAYSIKKESHFFFTFLVFAFCLIVTAINSPLVIAQNSSNIPLTVIGILGYAAMMGSLLHLYLRQADVVLNILKSVSSATILILASVLILSESNLIPFLARQSLLYQNSRLIDNYTSIDALMADEALGLSDGQLQRIDLFYGEPSFLAIVLFACMGCLILISRIQADIYRKNKFICTKPSFISYEVITLIGIFLLMYIQSLSSIFYAFIITYFSFIRARFSQAKPLVLISFFIILIVAFFTLSYDYFIYRITQTDSLSFMQRFSFFLDMSIKDLLIGIKDESLLPDAGIHNGLIYIITISGFGGLFFIASLLYSAYTLSAPMKLSLLSVLLILAIVMQNGGIFSPNKVVLLSLILLPLACARAIRRSNHIGSICSSL